MLTSGDSITTDLPCISCGYSLRTLGTANRCPECGLCVAISWEYTLFRAAPSSLNRLAGAIALTATANVIAIVGAILLLVLLITFETMHSIRLWWLLVPAAAYAGTTLVHVIGDFRSTAPLACQRAERHAAKLRRFSSAYFLLIVAALFGCFLLSYDYPNISDVGSALVIGWAASLPLFCLYQFAAGRFFERLCQRGGIRSLVSWHHGIWLGLAIGTLLADTSFILVIASQIFQFGDAFTDAFAITFFFGSCVAGLSLVAITIFLFLTARAFRRLADNLTKSAMPLTPTSPAAA